MKKVYDHCEAVMVNLFLCYVLSNSKKNPNSFLKCNFFCEEKVYDHCEAVIVNHFLCYVLSNSKKAE